MSKTNDREITTTRTEIADTPPSLTQSQLLILAALMKGPLSFGGIRKRIGIDADSISKNIYPGPRSHHNLPPLLKRKYIMRYGTRSRSAFGINPKKLAEIKRLIQDVELPDPEKAAARYERYKETRCLKKRIM